MKRLTFSLIRPAGYFDGFLRTDKQTSNHISARLRGPMAANMSPRDTRDEDLRVEKN
jgi:hypothetical protein